MTKPHTTLSEAVRALEQQLPNPTRLELSYNNFRPNDPAYAYGYTTEQVCTIIEAAAKLVEQHEAQEPVGTVVGMPGSGGGFTMCAFKASDVAIGTLLYAQPTLAATQAGDAWQPIETAPKNMSSHLYLIGRYCVQGFVDAAGELMVQSEVSPHWRKMRGKPTHWMPLPSAPTTTRSE